MGITPGGDGKEISERMSKAYQMPEQPTNVDSRLGDVKRYNYEGQACVEGLHADYIMVDGVKYSHSVIIFPKFTVLWRPRRVRDITADSLEIVKLFYPVVRHIFIGIGSDLQERPPEMPELIEQGLTYEFMPTFSATHSFNMQNSSGGTQNFCAAMLLPLPEDTVREEFVFDCVPKRQYDLMISLREGCPF